MPVATLQSDQGVSLTVLDVHNPRQATEPAGNRIALAAEVRYAAVQPDGLVVAGDFNDGAAGRPFRRLLGSTSHGPDHILGIGVPVGGGRADARGVRGVFSDHDLLTATAGR